MLRTAVGACSQEAAARVLFSVSRLGRRASAFRRTVSAMCLMFRCRRRNMTAMPYEYGEYGLTFAGGTSFATPSFAGLMALVNQKAGVRQRIGESGALYAGGETGLRAARRCFTVSRQATIPVPGVTGFFPPGMGMTWPRA